MSQEPNTPHSPPGSKPRRAQALQPDKPGSGTGTVRPPDDPKADAERVERKAAKRQEEQARAALDNVSKGYD